MSGRSATGQIYEELHVSPTGRKRPGHREAVGDEPVAVGLAEAVCTQVEDRFRDALAGRDHLLTPIR